MKKLMIFVLAAALVLCAGCGNKTPAPPAPTDAPAPTESFADDFFAALDRLHADCQPGTAGSSLRAAAQAAALADLFTARLPAVKDVADTVKAFAEGLSEADAALLAEQLNEVAGIFPEISGEHGGELLDACGYGVSAPDAWNADILSPLFEAMTMAQATGGDLGRKLLETYGEPVRLWGPEGMEYFQVKLYADHALREWGSDTEHTEHDNLTWTVTGGVLHVSGSWTEDFALDLAAETATSLADGHVYRLCSVD